MKGSLLDKIEQEQKRKKALPDFNIGDMVQVDVVIREGTKERVQAFRGTVMACDGGGATETFTVRRTMHGEGVERVFPVHSPHVAGVTVIRRGKVRRAKLYYLRKLTGKKARIREERS